MLNRHNLLSVIAGILLLVVLQKFTYPTPVFRFMAPAFLGFLGVLGGYNYFYLRQIGKYNFWVLLRPWLLCLAVGGLFFASPNDAFRGAVVIAGAVALALFEMILGKFSENILFNETLIIAFGLFTALAASNYYFPTFTYLYVAAVFGFISLLSRSFFEFIPQNAATKQIAALMLAFFSCQLFWATDFLPLHFSVIAFILLALFYFSLIVSYYNFFNILTYQKIKFHLWLTVFCVFIVLAATPWTVID